MENTLKYFSMVRCGGPLAQREPVITIVASASTVLHGTYRLWPESRGSATSGRSFAARDRTRSARRPRARRLALVQLLRGYG